MPLLLLAYLGGFLTIASPCILPVLPFVFARAGQPFFRSTIPMLIGMALSFALVASLAAVGGSWVIQANQYGRYLAMFLLIVLGNALLFPALFDYLAAPLVALGNKMARTVEQPGRSQSTGVFASVVIGIATGLLWAPCAGPILGLILTGAALNGANIGTTFLLLSYALGAATSLSLALLVGGRVYTAMKRSLGVGEWIRRSLGVAVLLGVVAIGFGLDTGFLTRVSLASTNAFEQRLLDTFSPAPVRHASVTSGEGSLPIEGQMPPLNGAVAWLNSPPLTTEGLKGKVVLIDFWTYSCINCLRALPYVEAWNEKYKDSGLVVIGVHTPEFAFEKNIDNVKAAVARLGVHYPVAIDNNYAIWRAFQNNYWPAHYFVDAQGRIRYHHFGEGEYAESERVIQELLKNSGRKDIPQGIVTVDGTGAEMASVAANVRSPETYLGWERQDGYVGTPAIVADQPTVYRAQDLQLNQWTLDGTWTVGGEKILLNAPMGSISYKFQARDLHLVLGSSTGKSIRYRVTIDGKPPGDQHGADSDTDGNGTISDHRLYQLIRQTGDIGPREFKIEFLDTGVQAFAFTFG